MNRLAPLLVALLVLLAGCSFTSPQTTDTPTPTPASTTTPESTPTHTQTPASTPTPGATDELAPGITREGITNPVALMSAHQQALLDDGFVVNQTVVSTYNGTVSNRLVLQTVVGPGGELASQTGRSTSVDFDGGESTIVNDLWLNTTTQTSRHVESGTTTYRVIDRIYPPEYLVWFGTVQRDIQFAADEYEVVDVEQRDGIRFVTLEVSYDRVGSDGVDDAFGTLLVDQNGVVHHATMNVSYDAGTTYSTTYDVVALGDVGPEPPAWLDAVPPSAALNVGLDVFSFTATSVELVHTHGDPAPAGTIVTVVSNETLYEVTLDEPFDGTRYLWVDGDGELRATTTTPSEETAQTLDTEITVTVRAPDGGELFSTGIGRR